ncbi:MAG: DUF6512 family protein [Lachnospiraceae bacterium]
MTKHLKWWELIGILICIGLGTLLHFVYQWSGNNPLVGLIAPVNESTWEHLKLLLFPILFYSILEYMSIGQYYGNFLFAKYLGVVCGMLSIIGLFYGYKAIVGHHSLGIDILIFIISILIAYIISCYLILYQPKWNMPPTVILSFLMITILLFWLFTWLPPNIFLFHVPKR